MRGGNCLGRKRALSLSAMAVMAVAVLNVPASSLCLPAMAAPSKAQTVELNGTSDRELAAQSLQRRCEELQSLLAQLQTSKGIKAEDFASFQTQLQTLNLKLATKAGEIAYLIDLAEELDSLMHRIAISANLTSFPSSVAIDSFGPTQEHVSDAQKNDEQFDIVCVRPTELKALLDDRKRLLDTASTREDSDSPRADLRLSNELARLEQLQKGLAAFSTGKVVIPVAVEHDLLGNRVLGAVSSYELRPIVNISQVSTPTASTATISEDITDQISQLETRLQREVLTERITADEASIVGEGLKTIVALEKEYRHDGKLSEIELSRLSSALFRLNSRLSRSVAIK